jgi:hypothetical protein
MRVDEIVPISLRKQYRQLKASPTLPQIDDLSIGDHSELIRSAMKSYSVRTRNDPNFIIPTTDQLTDDQVDFLKKFQQQAILRGYIPFSNRKLWQEPYIKTKNGVFLKLVVGKSKISRFYFNIANENSKSKIKEELSIKGFNLPERSEGTSEISIEVPQNHQSYTKALAKFWEVAIIIEEMGSDFVVHNTRRKTKKNIMSLYLQIANILYTVYKVGNNAALSRAFGLADDDDRLMAVGYTENAKKLAERIKQNREADVFDPNIKRPYREHAVPVSVLVNIALQIYDDRDYSKYKALYKDKKLTSEDIRWLKIFDVASIFQRNLVIVYTDKEKDTDILDRKYKQTMPTGWNPYTGDVLARFTAYDIPVYSLSGGRRLTE